MKIHLVGGGPWDGVTVEAAIASSNIPVRITLRIQEPDKELPFGGMMLSTGRDREHPYEHEARGKGDAEDVWYRYLHPAR
jgi:hypothetical protein